jgi:hypothetical protein
MKFYLYTLTRLEKRTDWITEMDEEVEIVVQTKVLDDCSDNLCIGYTGNDGKYWQFDSYEGWYAESFFEKEFHLHGLKVTSKQIDIPEEILRNYEV